MIAFLRRNGSVIFMILFGIAGALQLLAAATAKIDGTDIPYHLEWITRFRELIFSGTLFPKWVPAGNHGLGSPVFYFYPPLAYYLTTVLSLVGVTDARALYGLVSIIASLASGLAAYRLFCEFAVSRRAALLAGAVYAFAPYRVAELFTRASLSSHIAYIFLPLVALGFVRLFKQDPAFRIPRVVMLSASISGLLLSALPATAAALCFCLAIGLGFIRRVNTQIWKEAGLALIWSLAICAFYIVPAVVHSDAIQSEQLQRDPNFYALAIANGRITIEVIHAMVVVTGLLVAAYGLLKSSAANNVSLRRTVLIVLGLYLLLELPPVARPLWEHVPLLRIIQVPWRVHIVLLLAACAYLATRDRFSLLEFGWLGTWAAAAIVAAALVLFNFHFYKHWDAPDAYPPEYLPPGANVALVHTPVFTDEQLKLASIDAATTSDTVQMISNAPDHVVYQCALSQSRRVHLPRLYWPEWTLYAGGQHIPSFNDGKGFQTAVLPAGTYTLSMLLVTPPSEILARIVSVVSIVVLIVGVLLSFRRQRRRPSLPVKEYADTTLALHHETTAAL